MNDWRSNNRERWNAYQRQRKREHPEKYRLYRKTYNEKNPARVLELRKASYARRRKKIADWNKAYYLRNRDAILKQKTEYERFRRAKDPSFRCLKLLRNRIVEVLKYQSGVKSKRTKELIGCERQFLVQWIESKFSDGMTWNNHGNNGWHIDHIRPCASFDLLNPEQQKECFHYTNLQPLWADQNRIKSNKILN